MQSRGLQLSDLHANDLSRQVRQYSYGTHLKTLPTVCQIRSYSGKSRRKCVTWGAACPETHLAVFFSSRWQMTWVTPGCQVAATRAPEAAAKLCSAFRCGPSSPDGSRTQLCRPPRHRADSCAGATLPPPAEPAVRRWLLKTACNLRFIASCTAIYVQIHPHGISF